MDENALDEKTLDENWAYDVDQRSSNIKGPILYKNTDYLIADVANILGKHPDHEVYTTNMCNLRK